jgi:hypothetical protein
MRVKTPQFVLYTALALILPATQCVAAHPVHTTAHPDRSTVHAKPVSTRVSKTPAHTTASHATAPIRNARHAKLQTAHEHLTPAQSRRARLVETKAAKGVETRYRGKATVAEKRQSKHQESPTVPSSRLAARSLHPALAPREPVAELPTQAETQPQEPIQVRHNRKQHFDAVPVATMPAPSTKPGPDTAQPTTGVSHPPDFNGQRLSVKAPGSQLQPEASVFLTAPAARSLGTPGVLHLPTTTPPSVAAELDASVPSIEDQVTQTRTVAPLFNKRGQLIMPPALKGSHDILVHQNTEADREGLARVRDDDELVHLRERKALVALPVVQGLGIDDRLPGNRRYTRPWTGQFLVDLARAHYARFHSELIVTSAVRTVEVQERLLRTNGNAAPAEGDTASPHLTGQAVDIGKKGLTLTEIAWLRGYLLPLLQQGKVDVEEEFKQSCFHISVYREYLPQTVWPRTVDAAHRSVGSSLATAIHE